MQDNRARRSPRIFAERDCPDCGKPFTPRSGRQVRCAECREGPRRQECRQPGCATLLRRDNKIGFCEPHKFPTARAEVRHCSADECDHTLRIDNQSGYCPDHVRLSEGNRASRDRLNARLRAEHAARPDMRAECSVGGCTNRLRSDNTTGRCREHHCLPVDMPECSVKGCENRLTARNRGDRCTVHRGLYWAEDAPKCQREGCGKTLHADNRLGYCHEHRGESPHHRQYMRDYYLSRQGELIQYAREYREIYTEEGRAAARAWAAANPAARQAMHARRRQRVDAGLDVVDMLLSAEYRLAIRNDPCFYCGSPETHHVDHYFPLSKGGKDTWDNLVRSCRRCNLAKSAACGTAFRLRRQPNAVAA